MKYENLLITKFSLDLTSAIEPFGLQQILFRPFDEGREKSVKSFGKDSAEFTLPSGESSNQQTDSTT
jgi:hypothetical protein